MPKTITLLGSTGSIGTQSLDVARMHGYRIFGLAANSRVEILQKQIEEFHPKYVCMTDPDAAAKLDAALAGTANAPKLLKGPEGLRTLAAMDGPDVVLNAVVGIAGLPASLAAIESGHDLALANKESLVTGGHLVTDAVKKYGVKLLPVDSEHSAIFQCLQDQHSAKRLEKILLTASGGPFFGMTTEQLRGKTKSDALKHPNWNMGAKITIDSATLMNKGLELIEAVWLFGWMEVTGNENPFYEFYDELLEICHEYDVTISLGDSCRPGCLYDSNDATETAEMIELGKLCKRAWAAGVQVMVEGPGHMALDEIAANMKLQKRLCHNAPFYVLGPLVTDIGVGYDHITAAIGGAISASSGADFLCYVTPAEHLCLPNAQDVLDGLMATKIAAHAADIAKGHPGATVRDNALSKARYEFRWKDQFNLGLDPDRALEYYKAGNHFNGKYCTMCGPNFCAMRISQNLKNCEFDPEEEARLHEE